ncbi:MAG: hypothetical protein IPK74_12665 [Deltaproteobacteria bacterium]|nr:hypothetical protein [Deltaproteobacteria bacterium]
MNVTVQRMLDQGWRSLSANEVALVRATVAAASVKPLSEFVSNVGILLHQIPLRAFAAKRAGRSVLGVDDVLHNLAEHAAEEPISVRQYGDDRILCVFYLHHDEVLGVIVLPRNHAPAIGDDGAVR